MSHQHESFFACTYFQGEAHDTGGLHLLGPHSGSGPPTQALLKPVLLLATSRGHPPGHPGGRPNYPPCQQVFLLTAEVSFYSAMHFILS